MRLIVPTISLALLHGALATSSSSSRPPFSLSTIISDLEAEGVTKGVSTVTLLCSKSVQPSEKQSVLRDLLCTGFSEEEQEAALEEAADGLTTVGRLIGGAGLAFACADSPSEAASTVMACGKNMVYLCSRVDLLRGEGLFDTLAPAIEAAMRFKANDNQEGESTLIVVLPCIGDESQMSLMKEKFMQAILGVLPNLAAKVTSLSDVYNNVVFLPENTPEQILEKLSSDSCVFRDPLEASAAISAVAKATFNLESLFSSVGADSVKSLTAEDLASARMLLPTIRNAFEKATSAVNERATSDDRSTQLVVNFGELCDAALQSALESFDIASGKQSSFMTKKLRSELTEKIVLEFETAYGDQLAELKVAMFEKCRRELSSLRVSPNLAKDMEEKMTDAIKEFDATASRLIPKSALSATWTGFGNAAKADFKRSIKEYCTERLQAAKASGAFRPVPRKAISVGLHWLLPRPFGSDQRQATLPNEVRRNYVYHTPEGRSEVSPDDVKKGAGEWRSKIVPTPTASDMLY